MSDKATQAAREIYTKLVYALDDEGTEFDADDRQKTKWVTAIIDRYFPEPQSQGEQNGTEAVQGNDESSHGDMGPIMPRGIPADSRASGAQVAEPQLGDAITAKRMWETWPLSDKAKKATLKLRLWEAREIDEEIVKFALKFHAEAALASRRSTEEDSHLLQVARTIATCGSVDDYTVAGIRAQLRDAIHASAPETRCFPEERWIPVGERLPEPVMGAAGEPPTLSDDVWVCFEGGDCQYETANYDHETKLWSLPGHGFQHPDCDPSHWMPIIPASAPEAGASPKEKIK